MVECDCGLVADARCRQWDGRFGFAGWLLEAGFETFKILPNDPAARIRSGALLEVRGWVHDIFAGRAPHLILFGGNGVGKTHLAAAAANALRQRRYPVAFGNVPEVLDWLRSTFRPDADVSFDANFEALRNAPVLILDDLGAQQATPWAQEKLYEVINQRVLLRLPLLVTTNLRLAQMEPRLASRLRTAAFVDCGQLDWRQVER